MSCNNSCNNCSCNNTENSYEDSEDIPEYQELVPSKEYAVGEFFKIDKEVFKICAAIYPRACDNCDFVALGYSDYCGTFGCFNKDTIAILYDTLED